MLSGSGMYPKKVWKIQSLDGCDLIFENLMHFYRYTRYKPLHRGRIHVCNKHLAQYGHRSFQYPSATFGLVMVIWLLSLATQLFQQGCASLINQVLGQDMTRQVKVRQEKVSKYSAYKLQVKSCMSGASISTCHNVLLLAQREFSAELIHRNPLCFCRTSDQVPTRGQDKAMRIDWPSSAPLRALPLTPIHVCVHIPARNHVSRSAHQDLRLRQ